MRRKHLEMFLQKISPISSPKPQLEQYSTPAALAADILFMAYQAGEVVGASVGDLGCGSGIFAIGASLLGASSVKGYDSDECVVAQAKKNARTLLPKSANQPTFERKEVSKVDERFDIIFQNPHFGAQNPGADLPFLEAALRCSNLTYSIHNGNTSEFLAKKIAQLGGKVEYQYKDRITIPHMFDFHMRERQDVGVVVLKIRK